MQKYKTKISNKRIHKAIKIFGEDKIILGSDAPTGDRCLELNIKKIREMSLSDSQKRKILGENLARILPI